jgi:hypothetical protein
MKLTKEIDLQHLSPRHAQIVREAMTTDITMTSLLSESHPPLLEALSQALPIRWERFDETGTKRLDPRLDDVTRIGRPAGVYLAGLVDKARQQEFLPAAQWRRLLTAIGSAGSRDQMEALMPIAVELPWTVSDNTVPPSERRDRLFTHAATTALQVTEQGAAPAVRDAIAARIDQGPDPLPDSEQRLSRSRLLMGLGSSHASVVSLAQDLIHTRLSSSGFVLRGEDAVVDWMATQPTRLITQDETLLAAVTTYAVGGTTLRGGPILPGVRERACAVLGRIAAEAS